MNEWYYAEGNRQRQGPLPSENLVELYRSGRIALDTLVWREGLAQWQPLSAFAAELGLPTATATGNDAGTPVPPPLPPSAPAAAPAAAVPPPRQGLSGCAMAAIIGVVVGVIGLGVLGILAAIALPAYQDYTLRAKVSGSYAQLAPLKPQVEAFNTAQGRCPVNGEGGFGSAESYAGQGLAQVRIGRFDNGHCGIEAVFDASSPAPLREKALWLDLDPESGQWQCSSEIDDRYLIQGCRG